MPVVTTKENKYRCDECKLWYTAVSWAEKCEAWCEDNNSCNLEITKNRIIQDTENV